MDEGSYWNEGALIEPYLARVGRDWIDYFSASEAHRDDDVTLFNPFGIVGELVRHSPLHAWGLITFVLAEDVEASTLDLLAAGPLEDFISNHGAGWIDTIEEAAAESERFRSLLAGVWQNRTPNHVWARIVAARGDALPFDRK